MDIVVTVEMLLSMYIPGEINAMLFGFPSSSIPRAIGLQVSAVYSYVSPKMASEIVHKNLQILYPL